MEQFHFPFNRATEIVSPASAPLKWLTLRWVPPVREHVFDTGEEEVVLDIFSGSCTLNIINKRGVSNFPEIGGRQNVFAGKPTMAYIPRGSKVHLFAETEEFEGVLISAPAREVHPAAVVFPDEAQTKIVGKDNWQRTVTTSIGENVAADRLIIGETVNPPGNWSSAPPHKHDRKAGDEIPMEEAYLYKLNPARGFALQRIYTAPDDDKPLDVTYAVRDGDTVVIPRGYHPVVAAPGYQLFYLWALAGEGRQYGAWSDDPQHAWIKGAG